MVVNILAPTSRQQNLFTEDMKFEIISILGSGGFGTCYKASTGFAHLHSQHTCVICLKKINRTSKKKAALQSFIAETKEQLFSFDHPNIVKLLAAKPIASIGAEVNLDSLWMAFEYIDGCNLRSLLENEHEIVDLNRMCRFGKEISSALSYIHSFGIVHLDLKPANVMVTRKGVCKLADFGCSQYVESDLFEAESLLTGTCAYRAPELHCGSSATTKCDVYALGVCLWQFWSRVQPFEGLDEHVVIYSVVRKDLRPSFDTLTKRVHPKYRQLALQCWSATPEQRPRLSDVIKLLDDIANETCQRKNT